MAHQQHLDHVCMAPGHSNVLWGAATSCVLKSGVTVYMRLKPGCRRADQQSAPRTPVSAYGVVLTSGVLVEHGFPCLLPPGFSSAPWSSSKDTACTLPEATAQ